VQVPGVSLLPEYWHRSIFSFFALSITLCFLILLCLFPKKTLPLRIWIWGNEVELRRQKKTLYVNPTYVHIICLRKYMYFILMFDWSLPSYVLPCGPQIRAYFAGNLPRTWGCDWGDAGDLNPGLLLVSIALRQVLQWVIIPHEWSHYIPEELGILQRAMSYHNLRGVDIKNFKMLLIIPTV
jgi:hypothetical protein